MLYEPIHVKFPNYANPQGQKVDWGLGEMTRGMSLTENGCGVSFWDDKI